MTPEAQTAIDNLKLKLEELSALRSTSANDKDFDRWHMTTHELLKRYVRGTHYYSRFSNISFVATSHWDTRPYPFSEGCRDAQACLEGAIEHIGRFGLETPEEKSVSREPGGAIHIHGTIQNLAIAMDSAIQNVNQTASSEGEALKRIGEILRDSGELRQREVSQALDVITKLATELHETRSKWNWRNVLDWSGTLLKIARNATDVVGRLVPYIPVLVGLYEEARRMLG